MADPDDPALEALAAAVAQGAKYRQVDPALIRALGRRELATRRSHKEAVKAVKNKLHQVYGAFFDAEPRYAAWLRELEMAAQAGETALHAACLRLMRHHASTRERLPILERFYATALAGLPPPRAVLDIACGLNPLAIPWMGMAPDAAYRCYDIDAGLVDFLNAFFGLAGIPGRAELRDVLTTPPTELADLALVLKALPTFEQIDRTAGATLLRALPATRLLVSFPARSLGGRGKGMAVQYEARFAALGAGEGWSLQRHNFPSELAFLVEKAPDRVIDGTNLGT